MDIRYLSYEQIDKRKWDTAITNASNGLVYGYAIYLDHMAGKWDALVYKDYEIVMPLTYRRKYGIWYLYQPFFTAALGVFGNDVTGLTLEAFFKSIPAKFKYWDIYLNQGNYFQLKHFGLYQRVNYTLDLSKPYEDIYGGYRDNIKRNIRKAEQLKCYIKKYIGIDEVIRLSKDQATEFSPVTAADYEHFELLYNKLLPAKKAITYGIYTPNNELVASCALFFSHARMYYILVGNHPNGKTIGASHALINAIIKDHAGQNLLLDFEGSDVPNLAFFYSSFGATEEKYAGIKLNRLPKWIQFFKK